MESPILKAERRQVVGKKVKSLRRQGLLPAIVYGRGIEPIPIQLDARDASRILSGISGSTLIELHINGEQHTVLIRDTQQDPIRRDLLHIDFLKVAMDTAIRTTVPLEFVGEAPAVSDQGGILVTSLNEIEVEALPGDLPDRITVDLEVLTEIDQSITVADIFAGEDVNVLTDADEVVAHVVAQAVAVEEEEVEEEALIALHEEPEVIERGRKEEEAEDGGEGGE